MYRKMKYLLFIICITNIHGAPKGRICVNYRAQYINAPSETDDSDQNYDDGNDFKGIPNDPTISTNMSINADENPIICPDGFDFCYALWKTDENGTKIIGQGCWKLSEGAGKCKENQCLSSYPTPSPSHSNLHYCCCSTDLCNKNISSIESFEIIDNSVSSETDIPELAKFQSVWMSPIFWICSAITSIFLVVILFYLIYHKNPKPGPEAAPLAPSGPGYSSNLQNVDNLKMCSMIGQGKYGTVWKGMINDQTVAVKIFPTPYKPYFINERNIYSLPLMESPAILSYFGCDERRTLDDNIEYFLVLSLAPYGCLQDWLIENTSTYSIFCKMAKSITRGLSHLHTEIKKGDLTKPCVCHRDLNSRNILVKSDLSCCISDFGFALKTYGSKYEYKGEVAVAETKSINEVGTIKYMAPEILEGAVNLRDCETALKQSDVYSLGLVLWELCVRCHDLYPQGQIPPSYKVPYEAEIGKRPTFEQMQVLVSRHKARPLFPPGWGGGPPGKLARDTCEDCWDHDAEARLTALCAEERIHELSNLKPRSHISRGPSPPLSTNNLVGITPSSVCNPIDVTAHNQSIPFMNNCYRPTVSNGNNLSPPRTEKNHIIYAQQIQPFQGRNPCQERNLAPIVIQNQVLVEKSKKHSFVERGQENSFSCLEDDVSVEELISSNNRIINDHSIMGEGFPKQNNTDKKLRGWHGVRALIQKKLFRRDPFHLHLDPEEKSNLVNSKLIKRIDTISPTKDIRVNLIESRNKYQNGIVQTKLESQNSRPSNLDLTPITVRINGLSNLGKSNLIPATDETFTVIKDSPRIVISKSANALRNLNSNNLVDNDKLIKRQRSLELFREVFANKGNSRERLRDPSQRVKTPGDVPPSVRKVRASKTLSLYDDRMMDSSCINTL